MADLVVWKERQIRRLRREMDSMLDQFCRDLGFPAPAAASLSLSADGQALEVRMELAGFSAEEIEVAVEDDELSITAVSETASSSRGESLLRGGAVVRRMRLPAAVDASRAEASFAEGLLTVRLPRAARPGRRTIAVRRD